MPGKPATHCKRNHELTPENRLPSYGGRTLGGCRLCMVERQRARRGSTKTGPPSPYQGDETARLAAVRAGLRRCCRCREAKPTSAFNRSVQGPDGLSPRCRDCVREVKAADYAKRGEELRLRRRAADFGVTVEHLQSLLHEQGGLCAVCRRACPSGRSLAVDHDHRTGEVRGLLCANCNRGIGLLQDSPAVAASAAEYLRRWNADAAGEASL